MSLLAVAGANSSVGVYDIDNSLKFEADNNEYLSRTPSSAGNRRTWTLSCWVKRTELASSASMQILSAGDTYLHFDGDRLKANFRSAGTNFFFATNRVFRDTSAWYHIVLQCDTTQATNTDRAKLWVNGEAQTADWLDSYDNMALNYETLMNSTDEHEVGKYTNDESTYAEFFNGYMAEMHLVDGTALTPTDFGETDNDSGIWKPKEYTGSYGTNGFYLDFEDSSSLGADSSGNGNNFTLNNIAAADQATDTPTNNFAVLNTLHRIPDTTRKEGLTTTVKNNNGWRTIISTLGVSSGKWYFELSAGSEYTMIGVAGDAVYGGGGTWENYLGALTGSLGYYGNTATFFQDGVDKSPTNVSGFVADDIVGLALDVDNGKAYFHKNGTYQNLANPNTSTNGYTITGDAPYFLGLSTYQQSDQCEVNFGGYHVYSISSGNSDGEYGNFEYAPPSGYYALCTKNLAEYG